MSLYTVSTKRNRVYKRKFDHDEARRLYAEGGWTYQSLAEKFGVTYTAVRRVVDAEFGQRVMARVAAYQMSGECVACGGPRARYTRRNRGYEDSGMCHTCWAESKQTRFRFDEMGNLAAIRCGTCKQWKDEGLFPSNREDSRGKHAQCRECGTKARQRSRERRKVPCVYCGTPALPPAEKGKRSSKVARCRACFFEHQRRERRESVRTAA